MTISQTVEIPDNPEKRIRVNLFCYYIVVYDKKQNLFNFLKIPGTFSERVKT